MNNLTTNFKKVVFENYATFSGRAARGEYWYFVLASIIITAVLSILDQMFGLNYDDEGGALESIYSLLILIPSIAVGVRRLHDSDKSGWWLLLPLYNLYLLIRKGTEGPNRFGENPLGGEAVSTEATQTEGSPVAPATEASMASAEPTQAAEPAAEAETAPETPTEEEKQN